MTRETYIRKSYKIEEISYLSGIVDGEGSLVIGNYSSNKKTGAIHYFTSLEINNSGKGLIDWLHNTFGGNYMEYSPKQYAKNCRLKIYRWIAHGDRLTHLCELILPYSTIKKRQIEIMLEMRETYKPTVKAGLQGFRGLNQSVLDLRESLRIELRDLHCRKGSLN